MEFRKSTESGRKAAESWTGLRTLSPQHIIAFFGDTNYINHAQIRYVCEINHSPLGATCPRVSRFILYTYLLAMILREAVVFVCVHVIMCQHLYVCSKLYMVEVLF